MISNSNEFSQMYTRLYKTVYYFILFRVKNSEDAVDVTSEVFFTAYKTWDKLPESDHTSKMFLYVIAKSRIIDLFRLKHTNFSVNSTQLYLGADEEGEYSEFFANVSSDDYLPEEHFVENESKKYAISLLEMADPKDKQILISRYVEDMSYKEMSEIYEIKEQTLRKRVERALETIKQNLKVENKNEEK